jgi:hypothetical protein
MCAQEVLTCGFLVIHVLLSVFKIHIIILTVSDIFNAVISTLPVQEDEPVGDGIGRCLVLEGTWRQRWLSFNEVQTPFVVARQPL